MAGGVFRALFTLLNEAMALGRGAWYWLEVLSSSGAVMELWVRGDVSPGFALQHRAPSPGLWEGGDE